MTRTAFRTAALVTLLLTVTGNGRGQDSELSRETLRGLTGVKVVVEPLEPEIERAGLTTSQLQTDVELKLRLASIKVFTQAEPAPFLYVSATAQRLPDLPIYAFSLRVELQQLVTLVRNSERAAATTWDSTGVAVVGASNLSQVRDSIKDGVDKFVNAYLSVNPRQP
jgi:hypothetical protein